MYKNITLLIIIFSCFQLAGQTSSTDFTFQSNSVETSGKLFDTKSVFTKSGDVLEWSQEKNGNTETKHLLILSTTGSWDQNTSQGNISYTLAYDNYKSEFILFDDGTGLTAKFNLSEHNTIVNQLLFTNNTISY